MGHLAMLLQMLGLWRDMLRRAIEAEEREQTCARRALDVRVPQRVANLMSAAFRAVREAAGHWQFRSAGGGNELANLTAVCAAHHLVAIHRGYLRVRGQAPERLRWKVGGS